MEVKMLTNTVTTDGDGKRTVYEVGVVYDMHDDRAEKFIAEGNAEFVERPKAKPDPTPSTSSSTSSTSSSGSSQSSSGKK